MSNTLPDDPELAKGDLLDNSTYHATIERMGNGQFVVLELVGAMNPATVEEFSRKFLENVKIEDGEIVLAFVPQRLEMNIPTLSVMASRPGVFQEFVDFLDNNRVRVLTVETQQKSVSNVMGVVVSAIIGLRKNIPKAEKVVGVSGARERAKEILK